MRYAVFVLLTAVLANSAIADDLIVTPTSTFDQLAISVVYQGQKVHRAHLTIRNETGLTIAEGETVRDGIARLNIDAGQTLDISVTTPDGQNSTLTYMHVYE